MQRFLMLNSCQVIPNDKKQHSEICTERFTATQELQQTPFDHRSTTAYDSLDKKRMYWCNGSYEGTDEYSIRISCVFLVFFPLG